MPKVRRKSKTSHSGQVSRRRTQSEIIQDSVRTQLEKQRTNIRSELMKGVRDAVRKEMDVHQTRRHTTDVYIERLHEGDAKITEFIQQAITETARAYRLSVNSYIFSHLVALVVLIVGLILIFIETGITNQLTIAMVLIASGVIWVISLQSRSPVKNSRHMVNHLAKLNVIFAGYIRQMHQTDAYFESVYASGKEVELTNAEHMLNNLQDLMSEGMSAISQVTNDADE